MGGGTGDKTVFFRHLYIKTNILPRQARDKHRENSKKEAVLSQNEEYTQAEQIYTMALDAAAAAAAAAAASSSGTESVAGLDEERATVLSNR
jgi:hypothetical protein